MKFLIEQKRVRDIVDGTVIMKKMGSYRYSIHRILVIHGEEERDIYSDEGYVFLVPKDSMSHHIGVIGEEKSVYVIEEYDREEKR